MNIKELNRLICENALTDEVVAEMRMAIAERIEAAIKVEREACAKIADGVAEDHGCLPAEREAARVIACMIRNRE